jgi:hypothetical protein
MTASPPNTPANAMNGGIGRSLFQVSAPKAILAERDLGCNHPFRGKMARLMPPI